MQNDRIITEATFMRVTGETAKAVAAAIDRYLSERNPVIDTTPAELGERIKLEIYNQWQAIED